MATAVPCSALLVSGPFVTDALVVSNALIQYTKIMQKFKKNYHQDPGSAVVAETSDIHIVDGAQGLTISFTAAITGLIATGSDRTVTVDLQRSDGGGAFATVLGSPIVFTDTSALRIAIETTISTSALFEGDIMRVIVTVAGSAGNQAQGLAVEACFQETPI